jgi:hypothetical protein
MFLFLMYSVKQSTFTPAVILDPFETSAVLIPSETPTFLNEVFRSFPEFLQAHVGSKVKNNVKSKDIPVTGREGP